MSISFSLRDLLNNAGRHGPMILMGGAMVGLIVPDLANIARPLMPLAVFVFTLGAFLKVDLQALRDTMQHRGWTWLALIWSTFGVPLMMLSIITLTHPSDELAQGLILCALAPPVGSAAAIAAMLDLDIAFALLATVIATVVAPLVLPPLAAAFAGARIEIDPLVMIERLLVIVGGACGCAIAMRRFAGDFVRTNPHAMTGISVIGLIVVAIGAMRGMQARILQNPTHIVQFLALAFAVNIGFHLAGAMLFRWGGGRRAMTLGLVCGNRNITLAWAAAGSMVALHPDLELYLAMSVLPIFLLPAVWRWLLPALPSLTVGRLPFAAHEQSSSKTTV